MQALRAFRRFTIILPLALVGCASQDTSSPTPANFDPSTPSASSASAGSSPASSLPSEPASEASPSSSPSQTRPPRTVTINVSGDLLWHNTLWKSAQLDASGKKGAMDFGPQLASLQPFIEEADLAICHSEVPFAPEGGPYEGYPLFAAPPVIASTIKDLGWDLCTTASNHTMDQGWDGLVRTVDDYEAVGIQVAGSYRTEEESSKPVIYTTEDGVKVGIVSQTYGLNGMPKARGKDWSVDLMNADAAIADAKAAKDAGADIVAVHVHAGTEYQHEPDEKQQAYAKKVTASPYVDFVFGQHAHVVQPIEKLNGKWVLYGSGNLIAQSGPSRPWTYDGYMAEVTLTEQADGSFKAGNVEWAPTYITRHSRANPARVYLVPDALKQGEGPTGEMKKSAARTRKIVTKNSPEGLVERKG